MALEPDVSFPISAASQEQIDASRFAAITGLADDIAHELKNPLHAMVINLEVLKRRVEKGAKEAALERAVVLEHEVHRLHVLLESLLRILRPNRDLEGPANVSQILDEVRPLLELRARLARVEYSQDGASTESYTSARADLVRFALLLVGEVVLEAARAAGGNLRLTVDALEEEIHLRFGCTNGDSAIHELAVAPPSPGPLRGLPAAAALLQSSGGVVELEDRTRIEPGVTVLIRVPRSSFI